MEDDSCQVKGGLPGRFEASPSDWASGIPSRFEPMARAKPRLGPEGKVWDGVAGMPRPPATQLELYKLHVEVTATLPS